MADACSVCGLKEAPFYDDDGRCPLCIDQSRQNAASETETGGRIVTTENGHNLSQLQRAALEAISEHGSMRAAAKALGTNHGVISMALDGHETPAAYKALGVRKTPYYSLVFRIYDEADFNRARAAVGKERTKWLMEQIGNDDG